MKTKLITNEEFELIIENLDDEKWKLFFSLMYFTGAKASEILMIQAQGLSEEEVKLPSRTVDIRYNTYLVKRIKQYKQPEKGMLFPCHHKNKKDSMSMSRQAAHFALNKSCEKCGIANVTTRSIYKSLPKTLLQKGLSIYELKMFFGFSTYSKVLMLIE